MQNNSKRVLFLGDIVGKSGRSIVKRELKRIREDFCVDLILANVENVADGYGLTKPLYDELALDIDCMTSGNHIWDRKEIIDNIDTLDKLIRPANYPEGVPGHGFKILEFCNLKIAIINLLGRVFMNAVDCPFKTFDRLCEKLVDCFILVDFHGEATSEKNAFCHYVDGRANVVVGTHTHVQTNDERLFNKKTLYISDVGMCGALDSVIGMKCDEAVHRFLTGITGKYTTEKIGRMVINGLLFDIDLDSKTIIKFFKLKKIYDK